MRVLGGAAVAAALFIVLTACTPAAPTPTASPVPTSTPSPTTSAKPSAPVNSFGLGCANLVDASVVSDALSPSTVPVPAFTHRADDAPDVWAATSLGGLRCWWSNDVTLNEWSMSDPDARWAQVSVLPGARTAWDSYLDRWSGGAGSTGPWEESTPVSCFGASDPDTYEGDPGAFRTSSLCSVSLLVGDSWVEVQMDGVGDNAPMTDDEAIARATPFIEAVRAALELVGAAPRFDWGGAAPGSIALPATCDEYVSTASLSEIFGSDLTYSWAPRKGMSAESVALADIAAPDCIFAYPDSDSSTGLMRLLPGGRWAYEQLLEARTRAGAAIEPVNIDGLETGTSFLECAELPIRSCSVHVAVGGHWMRVVASNPSSEENDGTADELAQRAIAYAEAAVASLLSR